MEEVMKQRLTSRNLWRRALYMLFFVLAYGIAEAVVAVVVVVQFLFVLISGRANENLLVFGNNLSTYVREILQFQTFNSEYLAYPFGDWPDEGLGSEDWLRETTAGAEETAAAAVAPAAASAGGTSPVDAGSGTSDSGPIEADRGTGETSSEPEDPDPRS